MSEPLSKRLRNRGIDYLHYLVHPINLPSIFENGILPYNRVHQRRLLHQSLAKSGVQYRRNIQIFDRSLHDYVPLYLVRRNSMLWAVRSLPRVYVRVDLRVADQVGILFTDGNAASDATRFFSEAMFVDELPWDVLRRKRWTGHMLEDGKRKRCTEILIPDAVESHYIVDVVCSPVDEIDFPLGFRHLRMDIPGYLEP